MTTDVNYTDFSVFSTGVIRNFLACLSKFSVFIRNWSACFEKASFLYAVLTVFIYISLQLQRNIKEVTPEVVRGSSRS